MDKKQLLKDTVGVNFSSFVLRWHKLIASIRRGIWILLNRKMINASDYHYQIPIIINNFNRLSCLKQLVDSLIGYGYQNIHILDNNSTYSPLLEYYKNCPAKIHYLKNNYGHLALWKSGIYKDFYNGFYVYTDSDVVPVHECPKDFLNYFLQNLNRFRFKEKIGFSLVIDDLPDTYSQKQKVLEWEKKFWEYKINEQLYDAAIDTTFALYKPYTNGLLWVQNAIRTAPPYSTRHLPWYENSEHLTEEEIFYRNNLMKGASHWIK